MKRVTLLVLAGFAVSAAHAQYILDDGTSENSVGLSAGGHVAAANRFTVSAGMNTLTAIQMSWGSPAFPGGSGVSNGSSFDWYVWNQNAGQTRWQTGQITLVSSGTGTVSGAAIDSDVFQSVNIGSVGVATDFYVGIAVRHTGGTFPLWLDQNGPNSGGLSSWVGGTNSGSFDANNVSGGIGSFRMDEVGLPGAWSIRATAVPEPGTMIALGAGLAALAARRRRK